MAVGYASSSLHHRALDNNTVGDVFPQCDQQFSRQGNDHLFLQPTTVESDPLLIPLGKRGFWLVAQPQPGELDQCSAQPGISSFRDALFTINGAALPRRRCQPRIGSQLSSVIEVPE